MTSVHDILYVESADLEAPHDKLQALDLYLPITLNSSSPPPLVVYIHGGAWRSGDKSEYENLGKRLAKAGRFAVAVINYRLSLQEFNDRGHPVVHPDHINDCSAAIKYLVSASTRYGFRSDAIYLVGHSAGGQLGGLLVFDESFLKEVRHSIKGVVGVEGIYDIPRLLETWPNYIGFIKQGFGDDAAVYQKASPQYASPHRPDGRIRLPSYLIVHSPEDELVDMEQSNRYFEHVREAGAGPVVELDISMKGTHFDMLQTEPFSTRIVKFVYDVEKATCIDGDWIWWI
ncbi:hypothetical protein BZG36_02320 [Bifiguratus adelaidae]|uniref:BD-FAE-like domain-containing protein n=1 Tax=Bifiguratus adelaidae TaxID=1938954 RepID=A0A261Y3R9_9FUNG|nr:hypothetical protein BZG36_02320 [Bifiguratus adelaidae]